MTNPSDEVRHLAQTLHDMRPEWAVPGILKVLQSDPRPLAQVRTVALAAASDPSARGPGVIHGRDAARGSSPAPAPPMQRTPAPPAEVARHGAAQARAAIRRARDAARASRAGGEITELDVIHLAQQLCQQRPDWTPAEVRTVLLRLARGHGLATISELEERTTAVTQGARTPWGLLAAGPEAQADEPW